MKSFKEFIYEANNTCNKTEKGKDCPIHGEQMCPILLKKKYSIATVHPGNFLEGNQYKNDTITIEDANGNSFLEVVDVIRPEPLVKEERASGDYSLHDWFSKSKSKNGKPGWVQLGGPYAGKPCARQPGQKSTPKCGSSKMSKNLSTQEKEAAFKRKNRQDPNQPQKTGGEKPTNVRTKMSEEKDACYKKVKSRYKVWPSAYASGALVKCRKKGAKNWGTKTEAANPAQQAAIAINMKKKNIKPKNQLEEKYLRIQSRGTTYTILLNWRGKYITTQMFFQQFTRPSKPEVTREVRKVYPNAVVLSFMPSMKDPTKPLLFTGELDGPTKN